MGLVSVVQGVLFAAVCCLPWVPLALGECCFDSDVAYTGLQAVDELQRGNTVFKSVFDQACVCYCANPNVRQCQCPYSQCKPLCTAGPPYSDGRPPLYSPFMCPNHFLYQEYFCNNGQARVGSYCGVGSCNAFGCNCDGGCIEGSRRKLSATANSTKGMGNARQGEGGIVGTCQQSMIGKYKTYSLTSLDQIRDYFACLDADENNLLDSSDPAGVYIKTLTNGTERLASMDSNGDGVIDPSEFDSSLSTAPTQSGSPKPANCLQLVLIVSLSIYFSIIGS